MGPIFKRDRVVAFLLIFSVYHFVVRPVQPLRVLFGMRPLACPLRNKPRVVVAAGSAATALLLLVAAPQSEAAPSPLGLWYAEGGAAKVEVRDCGDALCGRVVWLRSPFDENGCSMSDRYNPDSTLRDRPMIGIDLLSGLQPVDGGAWDGGTIYDPTSGRTYRCTISLSGDDRLLVRGYVGFHILGRTTTWIRVGTEDRRCQAARADESES